MPFSDLLFIYLLLPVSLILYHLWDNVTYKNAVLLLTSLFFYAWGEPLYVFVLILSASVDFRIAKAMAKYSQRSFMLLCLSLMINLGSLAFFKYSPFLVANLNLFLPAELQIVINPQTWFLPIGISFSTFKVVSYQFDVYYEKIEPEKNYLDFMTYVFLFQNIMAGPIVRYMDLEEQLKHRKFDFWQFISGVQRFAMGLFKKVWIADVAAVLVGKYLNVNQENPTILGLWFGVLMFALQIYYDFSGYSDMAIGLGKMFGLDFKENFQYPFIAKSTSEFWRRWHISLSSWFNDYVFFPLNMKLKNWKKTGTVIAVISTFTLSGFWHGAGWNYILWGLFLGLTISLEYLFLQKLLQKLPAFFGHLYLITAILFSMTLFYFTNINDWEKFIKMAFGTNSIPISNTFLELSLQEHLLWLPVAILFCTPIYPTISNLLKMKLPNFIASLETSFAFLLIFIATTGLVNQTFQAFLYFQF